MTHRQAEDQLDLDAYFQRIGYAGERTPTLPTLRAIHARQTLHEPFRMIADGDGYLMQAQLGQAWKSLYHFDLQQQELPDYEVSNWYLSNHPSSHFVTGLMAARPDTERRYALRNNQLTIHHLHGDTERRVLSTVAELRGALEACFQITLPATRDLDPALQRLIEPSQQA